MCSFISLSFVAVSVFLWVFWNSFIYLFFVHSLTFFLAFYLFSFLFSLLPSSLCHFYSVIFFFFFLLSYFFSFFCILLSFLFFFHSSLLSCVPLLFLFISFLCSFLFSSLLFLFFSFIHFLASFFCLLSYLLSFLSSIFSLFFFLLSFPLFLCSVFLSYLFFLLSSYLSPIFFTTYPTVSLSVRSLRLAISLRLIFALSSAPQLRPSAPFCYSCGRGNEIKLGKCAPCSVQSPAACRMWQHPPQCCPRPDSFSVPVPSWSC